MKHCDIELTNKVDIFVDAIFLAAFAFEMVLSLVLECVKISLNPYFLLPLKHTFSHRSQRVLSY